MIKFLLITFLICYLIYKLGGFLLKYFFISLGNKMQDSQSFQQSSHSYQNRRSTNGDVDIDYIPKNGQPKKTKDFKGGEYVDYEEIK
jgi:hypothetical protein